MRAMVMNETGAAEKVFQFKSVPDPVPGPHDLLVEVHACGLNPVDTKIRRGIYTPRPLPAILGFDVSGVVKECGPAVTGFKPGDEIYASPSLSRDGSNAELVCLDSRTAAFKPRRVDHATAAAVPLALLTAWESLHDRARIQPWETVLIHAGAGGVGHFAIQLAKMHGCRVITTASRPESISYCHSIGADVVIDYRRQDVVQRVKDETDGMGVPVVLDTVGGEVFNKSMDCVAMNGRLTLIVHSPADQIVNKLFRKNVSLHLEFMGMAAIHGLNREHNNEILSAAARLIDAGKLTPHIHKRLKLENLAEAHNEQEQGHVMGKIVLQVNA